MEKLNALCLMISCLLCAGFCVAGPKKLRDPFSCSHHHGTMATQVVTPALHVPTPTTQLSQHAPIASGLVDPSSEWQVIAEKDNVVIMQHKDGSIREITLGKK